MARPRLIILVRHAQSEGNKNRDIHQTIPDHRVNLTSDGWSQAHEAGRRLRALLRPDDKLHFFTSPYRRTRETTEGILATLTSDDPEPSPFHRAAIKVYEEPRLREQDFGNFQPCSAEMERMWQERADYGHFFYRIPNGESAADAYDRVSGFNESLWRQFGEDDFGSVCVLVTHGLMSRVFLMKWYHFSVEYFEDLRNINHCEFLIMRKQDNAKYVLETKLRTWSELRRERALSSKDKDKHDRDIAKPDRPKTSTVAIRQWGGCPDGCDHTSRYKKHEELEVLRQKDMEHGGSSSQGNDGSRGMNRGQWQRPAPSSDDDDDGDVESAEASPGIELPRIAPAGPSKDGVRPSVSVSLRPRSFQHLHVGRDFGGTYSGHASIAGSDSEDALEEEQPVRRHHADSLRMKPAAADVSSGSHATAITIMAVDQTSSIDSAGEGMHHKSFVNRLGDAPPDDDTGSDDDRGKEDLDEVEKKDRSILGSIY